MKENLIVLAVLGHECHLTEALKKYLLEVAFFVRWSNQNSKIVIITSGGFTNHTSAPSISEAKMMADFLKDYVFCEILLDKSARTTREKMSGIHRIIKTEKLNPDEIFIFCDRLRKVKVNFFAKREFEGIPFSIITHDFQKGWKSWLKQIAATPLTLAGFYLPVLHKMEILLRKRKMIKS